MPSRYSLWLEKYHQNKEVILHELKRCKNELQPLMDKLSHDKELILSLPDNFPKKTKACFVDGGEGIVELLGGVIYFVRASGLLWEELNGGKVRQDFLRKLDLGILRYDDYSTERAEFLRAGLELDIAMKCIEKFSPHYLFLDGSLHVNANPRKIPGTEWEIYRKKFSRLLKAAKAKEVQLCGISEDSHSRLLLQHLSKRYNLSFPPFLTDCGVLRMVAGDKKFMTPPFVPDHGTSSENFSTLYLQPTPLSAPLRVDFPFQVTDNSTELVSLITKLSQGSKKYGYPLPLYLVHLDAKIEKKQAHWNTLQILHHIFKDDPELYSSLLRERRRDMRPGENVRS